MAAPIGNLLLLWLENILKISRDGLARGAALSLPLRASVSFDCHCVSCSETTVYVINAGHRSNVINIFSPVKEENWFEPITMIFKCVPVGRGQAISFRLSIYYWILFPWVFGVKRFVRFCHAELFCGPTAPPRFNQKKWASKTDGAKERREEQNGVTRNDQAAIYTHSSLNSDSKLIYLLKRFDAVSRKKPPHWLILFDSSGPCVCVVRHLPVSIFESQSKFNKRQKKARAIRSHAFHAQSNMSVTY